MNETEGVQLRRCRYCPATAQTARRGFMGRLLWVCLECAGRAR